ncbi:hypothetical protein [Pseudoramibacter sp.]|jgi:hypothetical protein|uniref:hypothetical protein n=1 Tax=Pseudoramibacter sp. TaxID=2034862 RepID=UPI0025FE6F0D|nr:hypothetical protein [Pseudoramibacter sp.]MCH4072336.1 hypothetical protein [Pseudoramibacter sp.]MCH4106107.1 hypothetical protein [Pseudoramibacter sp.]
MLTLCFVIFLMVILFRLTGVFFQIAGGLLGFVLSLIGWVILGALAVGLLGLAVYFLPVVLVVGAIAMLFAL